MKAKTFAFCDIEVDNISNDRCSIHCSFLSVDNDQCLLFRVNLTEMYATAKFGRIPKRCKTCIEHEEMMT